MSAPALERPTNDDAIASVFSVLPAELIEALAGQGITTPTPVQAAVIPDGIAGHDVLGRAQTGSGKTLAFGIPVLARLTGEKSRPGHPRAVIVVPTRELAQQLSRALTPLATSLKLRLATIYGGTPYDRQVRALKNRADIVVATPGRLEDLIKQGHCLVEDVQVTVLDEADHLCDLGFFPAIDKLVGMTPAGSQRMLLSATLDGDVDRLVKKHLRNPKLHQLDPNAGAVSTMTHHTMVVGGFRDKVEAATRLISANGSAVVFTRTREGAVELSEALTAAGVEAVDLHGNLSQRVRERNLHKFSSGKVRAVVATDVAARGIHVDNVDMVIHFDAASDPKAYLHRSGRTARAGKEGCVVTITTPKFLDQVVRLQRGAKVEVLHHDLRTAPRVLTAEALAETGAKSPAVRAGGARTGGSSYGGGERKSYGGGQRGGPRRPEGGRSDGRRPASGGRSGGSSSQRWSDNGR
ncbi:MAG TPA: DEAD/DEAH box helicase [Nocardioides sp.]|nr:DEAD/DEAH box helicase [Nocardioides sp.]